MSAVPDDPFERNLDAFLGPRTGRRTLVLVGHLPVLSGLWLSQYADRDARDRGPVCMLRLEQDAVTVELLRAGGRRPAVRPQATLAEALRAMAPVVSTWMVVPRTGEELDVPDRTGEVVVLTGADEPAVVSAYRLVKSCVEAREATEAGLPPISVAVLGADEAECARVAEKLDKTTRAFLRVELPVRGGLQRVAPVESTFRGTFDAHAPSVAQVYAMIADAERAAAAVAPAASAVQPAAVESARAAEGRGERFAARAERRPPRLARPHDAPIPIAVRPAVPARAAEVAAAAPPRGARGAAPAIDVEVLAGARAVLAEASREMSDASRRRRELEATPVPAAASTAVSLAPAPSQPVRARIVESPLPERLVPEIDGLTALPFAPPRIAGVELALDADGALHLVARMSDLANVERARAWARDHAAILALAHPALEPARPIVVDLVVQHASDALAIEGVRVHMLSLVEVGGRRGYLRQPLAV